ncbi:protein draper-like isoform X3 [Saccostrea cucullata]|uniref:protein draper-like isoform X3 n=1 Tax=Saccostrea cuccullata TaxID=36930 RepID=UPI002ED3C3FC
MWTLKLHSMLLMGITLSSGYMDLSTNKQTNQSLTRPCHVPACKNYYISSNAVDRNESTCTRSKVIGGDGTIDSTVWWRVDLGDIYSVYSISIMFKNYAGFEARQRGRLAGFSLYLSASTDRTNDSLCYRDGPDLPPLNFTTTCTGYGRYAIFYNERLDGIDYPEGYERRSYTELCEVIVKGCNKTYYGRTCDKKCPGNCENKVCNIINGTCPRCTPGWTGPFCRNKCWGGWHGLGCKQRCSGHCKNKETCNHVTGRCDDGCADGWMGIQCEKPCKDGNYGPGCIYNCSGHCLNDVHCNKQNGHCDTGCKPGYSGNLCNAECNSGYFGAQCKGLCSQKCFNDEICNHINGVCTNGCKDGYTGERCNETCELGYFGSRCSRKCSVNCINTFVCKNTDGACRCAPGWTGSPTCNIGLVHIIKCSQAYGENCQIPCSENCMNRTCDRFNGSCLTECMGGTFGEKCDQGRVASSGDSGSPLTFVVIVGVLTVFIIFAVIVIISIRRKIVGNFKTSKKCSEKNGTENIEVASENVNEYQELSASRDNNDYQSIRLSEVTSVEQSNTYQNLVLTTL